jgi:hypothetical protein
VASCISRSNPYSTQLTQQFCSNKKAQQFSVRSKYQHAQSSPKLNTHLGTGTAEQADRYELMISQSQLSRPTELSRETKVKIQKKKRKGEA